MWAGAIGLLGLALRIAFVVGYAGHPIGRIPWVDEGAYWERARSILGGAWLPESPFFQDPLYPYLLAVVMGAVGTDVGGLRFAWGCLGTLTPLAVFAAARRGFGLAEAVVAGLLAALCGPLIFADGSLGKEGPAALVAAVALWTAARLVGADRAVRAGAWAGLGGWLWGAVALLRANALVLAPIGALWCGREVAARRWAVTAAFLTGFTLAVTPAALINRAVSKPREWILTTWQAGPNFYIGNGPGATGTYAAPEFVEPNPAREAEDFVAEARRRTGRDLSHSGVSRFWFGEGLRRWREAPETSARLLAWKLLLVAHRSEIPDNQDVEFVRLAAAPALGWGVIGLGILVPLAALGVPTAWRSAFGRWLVLTTVAGLGSTALFFVVGRYRVPWIPGMTILAALGTTDVARLCAARASRRLLGRLALIALPATAFAWWPIPDPAPDRWGHGFIALALAEMDGWRCEAAIDALDDARALGGGAAVRVETLLTAGPVRERMSEMVATRLRSTWPGDRSALRRARWLRQFPDQRAESRRLLDALRRQGRDDPAVLRESAAWHLGAVDDPAARRMAIEELTRASASALPDPAAAALLALATSDPAPLDALRPDRSHPLHARLRLARAVVDATSGTATSPGSDDQELEKLAH